MVSIKNLLFLNECTILWKWTVGGAQLIKKFYTLTVLFKLSVCLFVCLFCCCFFQAIVDTCAYNVWAIIYHTDKYSFRQLPYYVMLKKMK